MNKISPNIEDLHFKSGIQIHVIDHPRIVKIVSVTRRNEIGQLYRYAVIVTDCTVCKDACPFVARAVYRKNFVATGQAAIVTVQ
jgi:hypothetical protein